jgi:hypothetical protein
MWKRGFSETNFMPINAICYAKDTGAIGNNVTFPNSIQTMNSVVPKSQPEANPGGGDE